MSWRTTPALVVLGVAKLVESSSKGSRRFTGGILSKPSNSLIAFFVEGKGAYWSYDAGSDREVFVQAFTIQYERPY